MGKRGPAKEPLPAPGVKMALLAAQGADRAELLREVFGLDPRKSDHAAINRADVQMNRWRKHPEYDKIFAEEVKRTVRGLTGRAIKVIMHQLEKEKVPWLQNKAANDILGMGRASIFGEEENVIKVQFEGQIPDIGSPDQEEEDEYPEADQDENDV